MASQSSAVLLAFPGIWPLIIPLSLVVLNFPQYLKYLYNGSFWRARLDHVLLCILTVTGKKPHTKKYSYLLYYFCIHQCVWLRGLDWGRSCGTLGSTLKIHGASEKSVSEAHITNYLLCSPSSLVCHERDMCFFSSCVILQLWANTVIVVISSLWKVGALGRRMPPQGWTASTVCDLEIRI